MELLGRQYLGVVRVKTHPTDGPNQVHMLNVWFGGAQTARKDNKYEQTSCGGRTADASAVNEYGCRPASSGKGKGTRKGKDGASAVDTHGRMRAGNRKGKGKANATGTGKGSGKSSGAAKDKGKRTGKYVPSAWARRSAKAVKGKYVPSPWARRSAKAVSCCDAPPTRPRSAPSGPKQPDHPPPTRRPSARPSSAGSVPRPSSAPSRVRLQARERSQARSLAYLEDSESDDEHARHASVYARDPAYRGDSGPPRKRVTVDLVGRVPVWTEERYRDPNPKRARSSSSVYDRAASRSSHGSRVASTDTSTREPPPWDMSSACRRQKEACSPRRPPVRAFSPEHQESRYCPPLWRRTRSEADGHYIPGKRSPGAVVQHANYVGFH